MVLQVDLDHFYNIRNMWQLSTVILNKNAQLLSRICFPKVAILPADVTLFSQSDTIIGESFA